MERSDKEKILKAISTNVDDLLKQKVNTSILKQNLLISRVIQALFPLINMGFVML